MAGIDKIYGTEAQLKEFRLWLSENNPNLLKYVNNPDDEDYMQQSNENNTVVISNFPLLADKWLFKHCPLEFITGRIFEQYGGTPI